MRIAYVELQEKQGVIIEFTGSELIPFKSKLSIDLNEKEHYFEVINIYTDKVNPHLLHIKAKEIGYWCDKFDQMNNFDLRNLIDTVVNIVTDKDKIKEIDKLSCWC